MDPSFLARNVNEGFSGGEKKRNEILQLAVLESEMSILDEIDSGRGPEQSVRPSFFLFIEFLARHELLAWP